MISKCKNTTDRGVTAVTFAVPDRHKFSMIKIICFASENREQIKVSDMAEVVLSPFH